jgi:para-nitrobenzyl esterase
MDSENIRLILFCCLLVYLQLPVDLSVKTYPVIVFLEGEMFTQGNPGKYPAEDLAAEGLVVVSVHYRLGIFGMLTTVGINRLC